MFRFDNRLSVASLISILALPAFGQIATPLNRTPRQMGPAPAFTAEFKTLNVRTLADGTTITRETRETDARDSQGRSFHLTTLAGMNGSESTHGQIENPIDNTSITWDSHRKKATVIELPPVDQRFGCWRSDSGRETISYGSRPGTAPPVSAQRGVGIGIVNGAPAGLLSGRNRDGRQREELGTTIIQGLEAKGERWTTVIPAGEMGNDKPITTVRETWRATGFPFILREVYEDPRMGKRTRETVSLTMGEPDISLFQPPDGYELVTEEMHEIACAE